MMRFSPQLALSRLSIFKRGTPVYDERFHLGVNIIRGANSSGKSTVAEFIFYVLGGENPRWTPEAAACDFVMAEVLINGVPVTLRREVSPQKQRPLSIFWGSMDEAENRAAAGWEKYPYAQREAAQSFSQVLFKALQIPEVRGELSSVITMHQLLRLMYVDQRTPYDQMFRIDEWDRKIVRDAVGALLCGFYDDRLYDAELLHRQRSDELAELAGRLSQIFQVLGDESNGVEYFAERLGVMQLERSSLYDKLQDARSHRSADTLTREARVQYRRDEEELKAVGSELFSLQRELESVDYDIADSAEFISALELKLEALDDAHNVRAVLGGVNFELCPACYSKLPHEKTADCCNLCKSPRSGATPDANLLKLRQEIALQIQESRSLQKRREALRAELATRIPQLELERLAIQNRLEAHSISSSPRDAVMEETSRQIGYLDRAIEDIHRNAQLALTVADLRQRKASLASEVSQLQDEIIVRREKRLSREVNTVHEINRTTIDIVKQDLDREDAFQRAEKLDFSFASNSIVLDGRANYSSSSMVVLKNSFHLALLLASARESSIRYPRFLLLDNIEDKGMEVERSHNFQRLIVRTSEQLNVEHQVIFTTSMLAPELDVQKYTVGAYYTKAERSLRIRGAL